MGIWESETFGVSSAELTSSYGRYINTGAVVNPTITNNGDGTIDIGTDGVFNYMTTQTGVAGAITQLSATTGSTALSLTDATTNYVYSNYNSGSPVYAVTTDSTDFLSDFRKVPVARVQRDGTGLQINDYDEPGILTPVKLIFKDIAVRGYERQSGLTLSTTATRICKVTAGAVWFGIKVQSLAENEANVAGTLKEHYLSSGTWLNQDVTAYDSTYYSDVTDRQTLGNNKYVAKYFFRSVSANNIVGYVHGNQYNSAADALAETVPTIPPKITANGIYVGKIVIQKGSTNGTAYPRDWGVGIQHTSPLASTDLTDTSNIAYLDGTQSFTGVNSFSDEIKIAAGDGNLAFIAGLNTTGGNNVYIINNSINGAYGTDGTDVWYLNFYGYDGGLTQFRNLYIGDGKGNRIASLNGADAGAITIKETSTPSAEADFGKIYTKSDNKLYFQDGAGTEHEIAFV